MRRQILENIRDAIANKVIAKEFVFINRGIDADERELPVININSITEEISLHDSNPKSYKRNFLFTVECLVAGNTYEQAADRLEDVTEMVEQILESNEFLNSKERATDLNRIEFEYESEGEAPVSTSIMYYSCERVVAAEIDEDKLRTLNSIHIDWKVKDNTTEDCVDAEDEISNLND